MADLSHYSDEELEKIANHGMQQSNIEMPQQSQNWLDKFGRAAGKFNKFIKGTHLPDLAGGFLQGAGDIGASLGNVVAKPLGYNIPHPNLGQYIDQNSLPAKFAFGAGELGAQIPAFASGAGALSKVSKIGENAPLFARMLQGAVSGAALGENKEGGGRLSSAALGSVTAPGVISDFPITRKFASKHLNQAKNIIQNRGVKDINVPSHLLEEAKSFLPANKATDNLLAEAASGNYNPLFTLQSDLARSARELLKGRGADRLMGFQANSLRQNLINSIKDSLNKSGHQDISKLLEKGQKKYRQYIGIEKNIYRPLKKVGVPLSIGSALTMGLMKAKQKLSD